MGLMCRCHVSHSFPGLCPQFPQKKAKSQVASEIPSPPSAFSTWRGEGSSDKTWGHPSTWGSRHGKRVTRAWGSPSSSQKMFHTLLELPEISTVAWLKKPTLLLSLLGKTGDSTSNKDMCKGKCPFLQTNRFQTSRISLQCLPTCDPSWHCCYVTRFTGTGAETLQLTTSPWA